jgi:hypothetical protein
MPKDKPRTTVNYGHIFKEALVRSLYDPELRAQMDKVTAVLNLDPRTDVATISTVLVTLHIASVKEGQSQWVK